MTVELRLGDYREVMRDVECDLLLLDAPYSSKTHAGHDGAMAPTRFRPQDIAKYGGADRQSIDYASWTPEQVQECVAFWAPRTRGWMVSLTDDVLFPVWREAMRAAGRTVFQDVPAIITGMTVRLCGDGPSSWAIHCAVSRPSTAAAAKWGTLQGGYTGPSERQVVTGGKPLWLMRQLVRDYSRPGQMVADCCAGGATTLMAARAEGRRAVGSELDPATFAKAQARLAKPWTPDMWTGAAEVVAEQDSLPW